MLNLVFFLCPELERNYKKKKDKPLSKIGQMTGMGEVTQRKRKKISSYLKYSSTQVFILDKHISR